VSLAHQALLAQLVNAVTKVQKVQPVFKVFQVQMVSMVPQVLQVNKLLHKLSVLYLLDTLKPTPTQVVHPVPFLFGLVTLFFTPLATTTTTLKISVLPVLAPRNLTPCQPLSVAPTKSVDTPAEMLNPTG
jgi:hypothetical protein